MTAATADSPNVIVIHPHNLGRYLGCYGKQVATPNIDALATESITFENYFCTAAHCSPARGSMWTGRYPHRNGLIGLAHLGWSLHDDERTLVDFLNDESYRTYLFGLQHICGDAEDVGFQHVQGSTHEFNVDEPAETVAERVEAFLESDEADDDDPFFASVGFSEVHRQPLVERCLDCGWTFDLPGYGADDPDEVEPLPYLPDRPGIREDLAHFHGMIHAVDDGVGRIVDALDESGLDDDTILVFTTDHGIGFPRAMGTCYDPGVETFLIVRWPGTTTQGARDDHLLSHVDFLPTMLDLVGGQEPTDIDGRSFAPLVTDEGSYEPRERLFVEFTWHSKYNPMRAVRTNRYKYIRNFGDVPLVYIPAPLFSAAAGKEVREEFYGEQRPEEELYDLQADPNEMTNLADDPAHQETLQELRGVVDEWMVETDDRLLEGDWPPSAKQLERIQKSPWVPRDVDEFC
ncbi:sulfatase [Haloarchaeobius sp. HME9146]|uniref:sulfatase family protein n=1 Tax=Haloarchaeobius sp. HME9146 TaxID=2978732 RepID=UPI0021C1CA70|nr:sulfatase [Haloarchaeobius sp. HME9146]MCT9098049.1 sulfatase [Haloarchaeobius sp. HME9146]